MTFEPPPLVQPPGIIHTRAGYPTEVLPPHARELLLRLRQRSHDAHRLLPEFADRQEINTARGHAERRLQRLLAAKSAGGYAVAQDHREVAELRHQLATLADEAQRLAELDAARSEQWRLASRTLSNVEDYLRAGKPGNCVLQDYDGEVPKLLKGETILDGIENRRRRARELRADLHRIASAPFPSSHAKAQMRQQIEALAQAGCPDVASLVEHDRQITFQTQRVTSAIHNVPGGAVGFGELPDAVALFAWTFKDQLIKRLDQEIDVEADDAASLSHEDRQRREVELLADLLAVERDESALTWLALEQKLPAEFRPDCNALAILQCQLVNQTNGGGR